MSLSQSPPPRPSEPPSHRASTLGSSRSFSVARRMSDARVSSWSAGMFTGPRYVSRCWLRGVLEATFVRMATFDDVARVALDLPETAESEHHGHRRWSVGGKMFAWERPFSKADIKRFGSETPPDGPILAVRVEDLVEKEAVLAAHPKAFFTIPHFDGYASVLIQMKKVTKRELKDALVDGWLACAPPKLADSHAKRHRMI